MKSAPHNEFRHFLISLKFLLHTREFEAFSMLRHTIGLDDIMLKQAADRARPRETCIIRLKSELLLYLFAALAT